MTLLSPWAAVLAGAVGVPVVLLLYMLKLRRRPLRVSSTMLWEEAVQDLHANEPLRWLRPSVLLFLQLLALAAIAVAIGRPVIGGDSASGSRVLLIVDCSASMSARDGAPAAEASAQGEPEARFISAKRAARKIVEDLSRSGTTASDGAGRRGGRPEVMLVALAQEARTLTPFTAATSDLRQAIDALEPTDQPLNLSALADVLRAVDAPVAGETGNPDIDRGAISAPIDIRFITDGGLPTGPRDLDTGDDLSQALAGRRIRVVYAGAAKGLSGTASPGVSTRLPVLAENAGIIGVGARRDAQDPAIAHIFVRLLNGSASPRQTVLTCAPVTGETLTRVVDLPASRIEADGRIEPGGAVVTFRAVQPGPGLARITIAGSDVLPADDEVALELLPLVKPSVLVVVRDVAPPANPAEAVDPFLFSALEASDTRELRIVGKSMYEERAGITASAIDAATPRGSAETGWGAYDLVVFDRTWPRVLPDRPTLTFGGELPGIAARPRVTPATARSRWRLLSWQRSHPLLRDVKLDSLVVSPALPFDVSGDGQPITLTDARTADVQSLALGGVTSGAGGGPSGTTVGSTTAQPLIVSAEVRSATGGGDGAAGIGAGRTRLVRHAAVGFDIDRSTWGPSESFPIFMSNALDWLTGTPEREGLPVEAGRFATTREALLVEPITGVSTIEATGVINRTVTGLDDDATIDLGVPTKAGIVQLSVPGRESARGSAGPSDSPSSRSSLVRTIPVNLLSADESLCLSHNDPPLFRDRSLDDAPPPPASDSNRGTDDSSSAMGREIWHWFLMLAGIVLMLEWWVYAWRSRT